MFDVLDPRLRLSLIFTLYYRFTFYRDNGYLLADIIVCFMNVLNSAYN